MPVPTNKYQQHLDKAANLVHQIKQFIINTYENRSLVSTLVRWTYGLMVCFERILETRTTLLQDLGFDDSTYVQQKFDLHDRKCFESQYFQMHGCKITEIEYEQLLYENNKNIQQQNIERKEAMSVINNQLEHFKSLLDIVHDKVLRSHKSTRVQTYRVLLAELDKLGYKLVVSTDSI